VKTPSVTLVGGGKLGGKRNIRRSSRKEEKGQGNRKKKTREGAAGKERRVGGVGGGWEGCEMIPLETIKKPRGRAERINRHQEERARWTRARLGKKIEKKKIEQRG